MTLIQIKNAVNEMDPFLKRNSKTFRNAVMLIASTQYGPTQPKLCRLTGYSPMIVKRFLERARAGGILKDGKILHSGWFDKSGGIAFWCDVAVIEGLAKRVSLPTNHESEAKDG